MRTSYISSKPYKAWCNARGIDFAPYIRQFPLLACRLTMPKVFDVIGSKHLTLWEKIKNFFKY